MTISSTNRKAGPYAGNDSTTVFPFAFKVFGADDVFVVRADATGAETVLVLDSGYTVLLNADQDANPGGSVTLPAALASGYKITIASNVTPLQATDLTNQGGFYPKVITNALDKLTILIQQMLNGLGRSLKFPISESLAGVTLPPVSQRANQYVAFDSSGNVIVRPGSVVFNSNDAAVVGFLQSGSGAVKQTVEDVLRERVSVKDFGAVGDGVADDQVGLVDAVAHCFASGNWLFWPDGTYVSTASIPNFHKVNHFGPGVVKRGSMTFTAAPANKTSSRNVIYVSALGTEDGLSPDFPAGLDSALAALSFRGPAIDGLWGINLAAGTYAAATETLSNLSTDNYILICGPDVSGGVPTAVLDAAGGERALRIVGRCNVQLQDIKGINATASSVASAFIVDNGGIVYAQNVHTYNTTWAGINFNVAQRAVVYGGKFENSNGYGVRCYGGTVLSIGKDGDRPQFVNCVKAGVIAQGNSYGHVDFCDFTNCGIGVNTVFDSHVANISCTYTGCATPAQAEHNSSITFEPTSMAGYTRQMRSRRGVQVSDTANGRFDEQTYPYSGTNGKTAYGYSDWVVPTVKFQYSNNGTTAGYNISGFTPCTALWESNGNTILGLAAPDANYSAIWFGNSTSVSNGELRQDSTSLHYRQSGTSLFQWRTTDYRPVADNTAALGVASNRWGTVYAGTGTINTSDSREKQQVRPLAEAELAVARRLKGLVRAFKFNDAVERKRDSARIHVGVIAQDVKAAFEAEGLDPFVYSMLCYDEWRDEFDDEGNLTTPAGSRYGVRYEELLAFIIGAM